MGTQDLVRRFKAAKDQPPSRLMALVRRTVTGPHPQYTYYPGTEAPHIFTFKATTAFAVMMPDLKILLRNGLMRMQVNDPGQISFYFAPVGDETIPAPPAEKPRDVSKVDFYMIGHAAFKNGLSRTPAHDPSLMRWLRGRQPGDQDVNSALTEWLRGWDRANLDAPVT